MPFYSSLQCRCITLFFHFDLFCSINNHISILITITKITTDVITFGILHVQYSMLSSYTHDFILCSNQPNAIGLNRAVKWFDSELSAHPLFSALPITSFVTLLSTSLCVSYLTHRYLIIIKWKWQLYVLCRLLWWLNECLAHDKQFVTYCCCY